VGPAATATGPAQNRAVQMEARSGLPVFAASPHPDHRASDRIGAQHGCGIGRSEVIDVMQMGIREGSARWPAPAALMDGGFLGVST